jgi:N-acetylmuramoyl-L-alanine amidase
MNDGIEQDRSTVVDSQEKIIDQAKRILLRLGFLRSEEDSISNVHLALQAFQQERGLTVDGELTEQTIHALDEARWKLGDRVLTFNPQKMLRGDDVANLQTRLLEMGFNTGRVDGIFGPATEKAIKDFQQSVGAPVDGSCGPQTLIALMRLSRTISGGLPNKLREEVVRKQHGPALSNKVIVIDPSSQEKDRAIAFDIAHRLEGRLIAIGVTVILTRGEHETLTESERVERSNSAKPDLVISIGTDSSSHENAHGVATYFYGSEHLGRHSLIGERFAQLVHSEIVSRTDLLNCRTHPKSWDFLRLTRSPAVRIDLGYLTNPGDATRLSNPQFRDTIVEGMLVAIQRLYLADEDDAKTGTLRISDLKKLGIRRT